MPITDSTITKSRILKYLRYTFIGIIILITSAIIIDQAVGAYALRNSKLVIIGDTKADVISKLGNPKSKYGARTGASLVEIILVPENETWSYGSHLSFRMPDASNPWPIQYKWISFRPESDELGIEFDKSGKVIRITQPAP